MVSSMLPNWDIDERERSRNAPDMLSSAAGTMRTVPRSDFAWLRSKLGAYMRCKGNKKGLGSGEAAALNDPETEGKRVPPWPPTGDVEPRCRSGVSRSRRPGESWPARPNLPDFELAREFS